MSVTEETGLGLTLSETPKTGFLATIPKPYKEKENQIELQAKADLVGLRSMCLAQSNLGILCYQNQTET